MSEFLASIHPIAVCFIVLPRRDTVKLVKTVRAICDNNVFVVVDDVNKYSGGYGMIK